MVSPVKIQYFVRAEVSVRSGLYLRPTAGRKHVALLAGGTDLTVTTASLTAAVSSGRVWSSKCYGNCIFQYLVASEQSEAQVRKLHLFSLGILKIYALKNRALSPPLLTKMLLTWGSE